MTNAREYRFDIDKTEWGDGPWQTEPDKVVWVDDATGLDCMVVRNHSGVWCGYVGAPPRHPWHGSGYDDVDATVHGGLTFAGPCMPDAREDEQAVCHNPAGRPDDVWWLGFDCAHVFDLCPAHRQHGVCFPGDVYRDLDYVRAEVESLARQAARSAAP